MSALVLDRQQAGQIEDLVDAALRRKVHGYSRETSYQPFLEAIVGKRGVAIYSLTQSIATSLGMSLYEEIARIILRPTCRYVHPRIYSFTGSISSAEQDKITEIIEELTAGKRSPNHATEVQELLDQSRYVLSQPQPMVADVFYIRDGIEHLVDIKTAKPNMGNFKELKRKLLEWVARKNAPVSVYVAIPYNPYHPDPYLRFTNKWLEPGVELKVQEQFWDELAQGPVFQDILAIFQKVGSRHRRQLHQLTSR